MKARYIISGRSAIVITPSGINYKELKALNMNLDDLIEALRCSDIYNLDDVAYAIIETNGKLCVIKKSAQENVTREDIKIKPDPASLPVSIIMDGRIMKENVALTAITDSQLNECIKKAGGKTHKDILLITLDANGEVFAQSINGEAKSFTIDYDGHGRW